MTDYNVGDKVKIERNSIAIGVGVIESIDTQSYYDVVYNVKLDEPITHVECLTDDLEITLPNGKE